MNFFRNFSTDSCETTPSSLFWADFEDEGVQNGLSSLKRAENEDEGEEEPGKKCIFAGK